MYMYHKNFANDYHELWYHTYIHIHMVNIILTHIHIRIPDDRQHIERLHIT